MENIVRILQHLHRELSLRGPGLVNSYCRLVRPRDLAKRKQVGSGGEGCQRAESRQVKSQSREHRKTPRSGPTENRTFLPFHKSCRGPA